MAVSFRRTQPRLSVLTGSQARPFSLLLGLAEPGLDVAEQALTGPRDPHGVAGHGPSTLRAHPPSRQGA